MKKKILFVYESMMTGGTTTALLSLFHSIDLGKYEISLLLYTNTGELIDEIPPYVHVLEPAYRPSRILRSGQRKIIRTALNGGVFAALGAYFKYRRTPKGRMRYILMHYGMKAQVSLSRTVAEEYDYAIGFMEGFSDEYVASDKIRAKKKFVWIHPQYKSCYLIPEIDRRIFGKVDGIALVSEQCTAQFLEYFPEWREKMRVVPNITVPQLLVERAKAETVSVKKAKLNFCTVCRCDVQVKGLDRLLEIFHKLREEGLCTDVRWHLIGGGEGLEAFRTDVRRLGMEDTVILYGCLLNPLPYLLQMDAFLLASRYEGKPISVTEAQALGLPCLVTNYESARSQVQDGLNGAIMENNSQSIYKTIKSVIEDPTQLTEWKKNTVCGQYGNEQDIARFYELLALGD